MAVIAGLGSKLQAVIATVATDVSKVTSVSVSGQNMGLVPTVHLGSSVKTNRATIGDPGEVSFECFFDPDETTHAFLETSFHAGTEVDWKIVLSDAIGSFSGIITGIDIGGIATEENVNGSIKIKLNTWITWA